MRATDRRLIIQRNNLLRVPQYEPHQPRTTETRNTVSNAVIPIYRHTLVIADRHRDILNMVDKNQMTNNSGAGMSRAALKKKKKKRKEHPDSIPTNEADRDSVKVTATAAAVAARHAVPQQQSMSTVQTKKRKSAPSNTTESEDLKFGIIHDDDMMMEGDPNHHEPEEEDDEQVPMKKSAKENSSASLLPSECRTLHEIVLPSVQDDDDDDDKNDDDDDEDCPTGGSSTNNTTASLSNMTIEQRAQCALEFLLQPSSISKTTFYTKYYERLPLLVQSSATNQSQPQQHSNRYHHIFGISDLRDMIEQHSLYYGTDLNVTRYEKSRDGVYRRVTLDKKKNNPDNDDPGYEAVQSDDVWDYYHRQKCTIRLLCPQQYNDTIHALLSLLEHEFHCMVGANIYCTPPHSAQGFAPHYDDIDAYILQLEGYKRWKVYQPIQPNERLPRTSSRDYTTQDLMSIEPVLDVVLGPGDLLYLPRGWIHQACTIPESKSAADDDRSTSNQQHSLHLTISTMQQWAWADYLEILLPEALQSTIHSSTTMLLREGLPNGFLQYMGAMYDNRTELLPDILQSKLKTHDRDDNADEEQNGGSNTKREFDNDRLDDDHDHGQVLLLQQRQMLQEEFRTQTKRRLMRVVKEAMTMIDAACDQMGKRFLSDRLPPALTGSELRRSTNATTAVPLQGMHQLTADSLCQMIRPGIARLVLEDEMAIVYHCIDNSRVYQEHPISPLEFEMDDAPAIEQLLTTVPPHWIAIQDLIHDTIDDKIGIAQSLYDEGILAIRR